MTSAVICFRVTSSFASTIILLLFTGCGGGSNGTVTPPPVSVTVSPKSATVPIGTNQPFSALVSGSTSGAATWTASAGTIDPSGNYTAPSSVPTGGTASVTATSVSTPSVSGSATVTITTQPVNLSLTPANATVKAGFSQNYTATVSGTTNKAVGWFVDDLPGDTSSPGFISNGDYRAPAPVLTPDTYLVVAVSTADPTKSASASVSVTPLENQEEQTFPIKLGASGVNANAGDCCSGTLGSLLTDQGGKQYILSNNHIMGRVGHAVTGEAIVQPGFVDTLCNFNLPNTVANFTAAPPILTSNVDAAIAEVIPGAVDPQGQIIGLGGIASDGTYLPAPPAATTVTATVGMPVAKSGRTTGLSCGAVFAVEGEVLTDLPAECGNPTDVTVDFHGQDIMNNFAEHGDSGSLIVEAATSRPVALVVGISNDGQYVSANPVGDILSALESSSGLKLNFVGAAQHSISCSPASATQTRSSSNGKDAQPGILPPDEISRAILVEHQYREALMKDPAVLGIAVGRSEAHDQRAAVLVFIEHGKFVSHPLPTLLEGLEVRIISTGRFRTESMSPSLRRNCSSNPARYARPSPSHIRDDAVR